LRKKEIVMADIALNGDELKKLVKIAKKRDLNFAYCPGNDPKEDVFVLHRKKKPELMGRVARAEGTGSKLAFGTARVKGRLMSRTCDREMPQTAKKLKKFLKFEKVPMNVLVMDKDGNVLEEDVEDLPEDPELDSDDDDDADENAETSDNKEAGADNGARLKQLTGRAQEVKTSIDDLAPDAKAAMSKGFTVVLSALKGKDLDKADTTLTKLEAAVEKLNAKGNEAAPDPALTQLRAVADGLQPRIEALGIDDGAARLLAAHRVLVGQIDTGDVEKATGTATALKDAIASAEKAGGGCGGRGR
jgi:hypothetical protein